MNIRPEEVAYTKEVGKMDGKGVFEIELKGGLHLICAKIGKTFETLGAGSHRAIARFLAKKRDPNIQFTDLNKSDHVPLEHFQDMVPYYEALTEALRKRQGLK